MWYLPKWVVYTLAIASLLNLLVLIHLMAVIKEGISTL